MKIAPGPKTVSFKILRYLFFFVLCVTVVVGIGSIILTIRQFKKAGEWDWDTLQSQTYETREDVKDLRIVAVIAAIVLTFGFTNIVFGFLGAITLWLGPLLIFGILDSLTLILSGVVIAHEETPNISIGWLSLNVARLLIAILLIREVKLHNDEVVRRRVMEKEVSEH